MFVSMMDSLYLLIQSCYHSQLKNRAPHLQTEDGGNCFGKETNLAFARLSEVPFHWCFLPDVSSIPLTALSALDTCS